MVVKNNPIAYLENHGYVWTSDPTLYYESYNPNRGKKPWGKRDHYEYGINVDSYCGGYHRAYDMAKWHGAAIPAIANATVLAGTGWNTFGWTLVLGFKDAKGRLFQVIYGHLNRNPLLDFKVGQNVKKGQTVAYQGASNNLNVSMNSHLHIQFQNYQALNEWNFTCLGIDPLNIDVSTSSPSSGATPTSGTASTAKPNQNSSTKYPKATMGTFRKNSLGIQWAPATGVWINGGHPIEKRRGSPRILKNNSAGLMKPGQRLDYREIARSDGHIWLLDKKSSQWVPVKTWNSVTGAVGPDWGTWK